MKKRAKRQHIPNAAEVFNGEYMLALNEKFKVRGQLGALMNQLEEVRARNERLKYTLQEKDNPTAPRATRTPRATTPMISPAASAGPSGGLRPAPPSPRRVTPPPTAAARPGVPTPAAQRARAVGVQTVQPEPPQLFAEDPIRGLPPVIIPAPLVIPVPSTPPRVNQPPPRSPPNPPSPTVLPPPAPQPAKPPPQLNPFLNTVPRSEYQDDEGIDVDLGDDLEGIVVIVKRKPSNSSTASNQDLEDELARLRKRYEEITFYTIVIIFALFSIMLLKEMRLLMVHKPSSAPPSQSVSETSAVRPKAPAPAPTQDIELSLRLESAPPGQSVRSCGDCGSTSPPSPPEEWPVPVPAPAPAPESAEQLSKLILKAAPPCDDKPIIEVKCGELPNLIHTKYDCDECNRMMANQTSVTRNLGMTS